MATSKSNSETVTDRATIAIIVEKRGSRWFATEPRKPHEGRGKTGIEAVQHYCKIVADHLENEAVSEGN